MASPSGSSKAKTTRKKADTSGKKASASKKKAAAPDPVELYRQMFLIRRLEESAAKAYAMGKIGGFLHLYIGQEAVGVGAIAALEDHDTIVATYRDHGQALARGMSAYEIFAELMGKEAGCARGRGGSMHLFDKDRGFLGGYGIVGGHIPIAAGAAFAHKYKEDGGVTLCFFGDGAANMGAFHEGMALTALWELPVVFICENNRYSMGTPLYRSLSVQDVSLRALSHGMDHQRVAGDDVLWVYEHVKAAVDRARKDSTPTLIEMETYRFRGHSMADPAKYRTKEELDKYMERDPLNIARNMLLEEKYATEKQIKALEEKAEKEIQKAQQDAENAEEPDPEDFARYTLVED